MKSSPFFLLAPIAALVLSGCSEAPASEADKSPRPVQVIELGNHHQNQTKLFSGILEAADSANLAFKVPGTIQQVLVNTGDTVTQGQVIARLDPHDYQVTVMELEARLEEAMAAQTLADIELKRVRQATGDNAIAAVNLDRAVSGYKRSNAMVKVVQQNLQKAKDALAYTELTAPFDGVIGKRFSEQFEQAAPGLPVFTLHQPNQLQASIDMPENLVSQFRHTTTATISWYGSDQAIAVTLKEISTLPDPIKQTYTLIYQLDNPSHDLLPGKAIQLSIAYEQADDSYCVPYSAIVNGESGPAVFIVKDYIAQQKPVDIQALHIDTAWVFDVKSYIAKQKPVAIQSLHADTACVSGNLHAGDAVVTAGTSYLKPNQMIGATQTVALRNPVTPSRTLTQ